MKNNIYNRLIFFVFFTVLALNQLIAQTELDSIQKLEEVVITAQFSKQSIKKAVHNVVVITRKDIEQQAGNNLADILNQNLNINIVPNAKTGKSEVSLFGLDGQYFKILQDGIPIVSEEGFGNNIDLTQINLDDVKQIEIVEGSMGVSYGANAVSGIINIITKTSTRNDWDISISSQEETVGNEYEWWSKGRHIQALSVAKSINKNLYLGAYLSRNDFAGFLNDKKGKNHIENDGLRGYEWFPKEQLTANTVLKYKNASFDAFYKFAFFNEFVHSFNTSVNRFYNEEAGYFERVANDTDFKVKRFSHNINFNAKLFDFVDFSFSNAYQIQQRDYRDYTYDLITRQATNPNFQEYLYRKSFFSKATLTNFFKNKKYDFQFGLEYTQENGFGSSVASVINTIDIKKEIRNFDTYIASEIFIGKTVSIRPGFRYSYQTNFKNQTAYSLNTKLDLKNNLEWKNSLGSSFRTPNYDELYTYFVDSNHNVTGNENLIPENSFSFFSHIKKTWFKDQTKIASKLQLGFLSVKDRIDLAIVSTSPLLAYQYINVDEYRSINFTNENTLHYKNLKAKLGITIFGISQILTNTNNAKDDFLYTLQVNTNLSYHVAKANILLALNIKHNGAQDEFVQRTNQANETVFIKGTTEAFTWMDISAKTGFFSKKVETTIGIRNLLDIKRIKTTAFSGGDVHSNASYNVLMGYGRSFYIKLKYNISI